MDTEQDKAVQAVAKGMNVEAIKQLMRDLTYERGSIILTARKNGTADSPRTKAKVAKIDAKLEEYSALLNAKLGVTKGK